MNQKAIITLAVVGVGLYLFAKREAAQLADDVGKAVNPVSKDNIAYSGVNAVGGVLTGKQNFDLGVWVYDIFH